MDVVSFGKVLMFPEMRTFDQGAEQPNSTRELPANVAAMQSAHYRAALRQTGQVSSNDLGTNFQHPLLELPLLPLNPLKVLHQMLDLVSAHGQLHL